MPSLSDMVYKVLLANAGGFFGTGNGHYDERAGTALTSGSFSIGLAHGRLGAGTARVGVPDPGGHEEWGNG